MYVTGWYQFSPIPTPTRPHTSQKTFQPGVKDLITPIPNWEPWLHTTLGESLHAVDTTVFNPSNNIITIFFQRWWGFWGWTHII